MCMITCNARRKATRHICSKMGDEQYVLDAHGLCLSKQVTSGSKFLVFLAASVPCHLSICQCSCWKCNVLADIDIYEIYADKVVGNTFPSDLKFPHWLCSGQPLLLAEERRKWMCGKPPALLLMWSAARNIQNRNWEIQKQEIKKYQFTS